jgi:hypothetical protein
MSLLYWIIIFGTVIWLALAFEILLGLRIIKLTGPLQWKVHRIVALSILGLGLIHGFIAVGSLIFGWF